MPSHDFGVSWTMFAILKDLKAYVGGDSKHTAILIKERKLPLGICFLWVWKAPKLCFNLFSSQRGTFVVCGEVIDTVA